MPDTTVIATAEDRYLAILDENKERIYRICNSFSDDGEHAKDLAQEVFLNLWKSIGTFKGASHINTWVYRVTLNICLRDKTRVKKQKECFVPFDSLTFGEFPDEKTEGEDRDFTALYGCIKKLKLTDRSVILLYLEDMPYKEIAVICDMTENHVAVRIKRIREKLFNCLSK